MRKVSRRRLTSLIAGGLPLLASRARAQTGPVDDDGFVRIGGIEQWIAIQGSDTRNPAILYLHGGPGEAQSPFLGQFVPWQQDFTVVNWDQRGAGKTYGRNGPSTPEMTLDRLVDDAIEVAEYARRQLWQRKMILVGQSFGSLLGVEVIKRRPELFHAFVGTGQVVSVEASVPYQLQWARQQATAAHDQESLKALDEAAHIRLDPALPYRRTVAARRAANKWLMPASDIEYANMIRAFAGSTADGANTNDAANWTAGNAFSSDKLRAGIFASDLSKDGIDIPIPFFVIQGRDDHITPFDAAKVYFENVHAPIKAFIPIDGGHFACFTNADQFVGALRKHVRPLAI